MPDWPAPVDRELDRAIQCRSCLRPPSVDRDGRQAGRQSRSKKEHCRWLEAKANAVGIASDSRERTESPHLREGRQVGRFASGPVAVAVALFDNRSVTKEENAPLPAAGGAKPEVLGERDSLGQGRGVPDGPSVECVDSQ